MEACYNHAHGPHHLEDVFDHLMICGDAVSARFPLIKLAGYLHDVGKPAVFEYNPDKGHHTFFGHAGVGSRMIQEEMRQLRFSRLEVAHVSTLADIHMRVIKGLTPKAARRILRTLGENGMGYRDFLRLRLADKQANLAKETVAIDEVKAMVRTFCSEKRRGLFAIKDLAVSGKDIMATLGIPSGRKVGEVLRHLLERVVDEGPHLNDRDVLLSIVRDESRR